MITWALKVHLSAFYTPFSFTECNLCIYRLHHTTIDTTCMPLLSVSSIFCENPCKYTLCIIYRQHANQCSINKTSKPARLHLVHISMPNQAPCLWFSIHRDVTVTTHPVARCRRLKRLFFCTLQSYIQLSISQKMSPHRLKDMLGVHVCQEMLHRSVSHFLYGLQTHMHRGRFHMLYKDNSKAL